MSFLENRPAREALEASILKSIVKRDIEMCDTWNRDAALAQPFGIKVELAQDEVEEVRKVIDGLEETELLINGSIRAVFLKGDIKERKGNYIFIFRYVYIGGL